MRSPQREKMTKFQNNYIKNLKKRPMEMEEGKMNIYRNRSRKFVLIFFHLYQEAVHSNYLALNSI